MKHWIGFLIVTTLFSTTLQAQTGAILGTVTNDKKMPLAGATVTLMKQSDSTLVKNAVTGAQGNFRLSQLPADSFIVSVTSVGYRQYISFVTLAEAEEYELGDVVMAGQDTDLGEVVLVAKVPPVVQRGDTAQYNASQFKVNPDANAEDLIKKMPGITVDRSGTVTAQGEQVRSVTVDGKRFFGDDATAALKNLPAEIIDKIQVFDRLSDQAQFTGFDDGSGQRSINIVTKTGTRNGQFGRVYAGYGTDNRYAAGGNVSFFKGDRRISIAGLFNNVNQQNFSSEDLLGITGSGGGGRRGGRGGGSNNFLIGQANGVSTTNALGINYSDMWSKKTEVTGSVFLNQSNTDNNERSNAQYFLQDSAIQYYDELNFSDADNFNNRASLRIEHKIDSNNSLIFSPSFSFQNSDQATNVNGVRFYTASDLLSRTLFSTTAMSNGFNSNNNLLWRHSFAKKGRTLSVNLSAGFNKRTGERYLESVNEYFNSLQENDTIKQFTDQYSRGNNLGANISYTEPVGKKGQLQFSYNPSVSKTTSDQEVFQFDYVGNKYNKFDTSLSNVFDNRVVTHTTGVNYRRGDRDNMISVGLNYRNTNLYSEQEFPSATVVDQSFNNILPFAMFRKKFNARENIRLFYRGSTSTPSINQLQNVIDNSNPLFLRTGNPDLQQSYTHTMSIRYTYTNTQKGSSFFANIYLQQADDYVGQASFVATADSALGNNIILFRGAQLTKPVNMDGYVSARSFLTFGTPLKFIKSNLNVNGGVSWAKTPGIVNNIRSVSDNFTYSGGLVVSSNISEYVDFNVSYNANYNVVKNTVQPLLNNEFLFQSTGVQLNLLSKNGWFIQQDVSIQRISGLSEGFNQNYWLWNAAIGKKFLKNQAGELKLSVFDLLKQNQSISRSVTESYVEDVSNSVLTQYFMVTFSYRLRNFGKVPVQTRSNEEGGMRSPGGQRGPGGQGGFRPF
jgi:hypothetical protein